MEATLQRNQTQSDNLVGHSIASFITIFLLAFIDNGFSVFGQLKRWDVWLIFIIMSVIILFGQAVVREIFLAKYKGKYKNGLTYSIGIPLGIFFLYSILFFLRQ